MLPDDKSYSALLSLCRDSESLLAELTQALQTGKHSILSPNIVYSSALTEAEAPTIALASQLLPNPISINAESISGWAALLREHLDSVPGPVRLHLLSTPLPGAELGSGRTRLIEESLTELLKKKSRSLLRRLQINSEAQFAKDEYFAQLVLVTKSQGYLSIAPPSVISSFKLSPFLYGEVDVPEDKRPPARAYRKLAEALLRSGLSISRNEKCVDLGASPGSWSYIAIECGAQVTAVDRSPLREDLMEKVRFLSADGFSYEPPAPVDWLLCDIIAFPKRSIELLELWLDRGWCQKFCVTVKFRGREDYGELERLKKILINHCESYLLRQLTANKNEVTAIGIAKRST